MLGPSRKRQSKVRAPVFIVCREVLGSSSQDSAIGQGALHPTLLLRGHFRWERPIQKAASFLWLVKLLAWTYSWDLILVAVHCVVFFGA